MDCGKVNLVGYHLGAASPEERELVEGHLVACSSCVQSYLALKRHADEQASERPSAELRARLRSDVAKAFPRSVGARLAAWLTSPVPLYIGALAVAVTSVALLLANRLWSASASRTHRPFSEGSARIDTSRANAESLTIY
jgi:predicted anti-sigma-YlaC factor YlaD